MSRSVQRVEWSCLRRYVGLRINLFRAMHENGFHVAEDRTVVAVANGRFALVVRTSFSLARRSFYVRECRWYRADLEPVADDTVPEDVREELVRRFVGVLS